MTNTDWHKMKDAYRQALTEYEAARAAFLGFGGKQREKRYNAAREALLKAERSFNTL